MNRIMKKQKGEQMEEKKKKGSAGLIGLIGMMVLLIAILVGMYIFGVHHFEDHFYMNTYINGVNAGNKTVNQVKYAIQDQLRDYTLTLKERGDQEEIISGDQLYLEYVDDGTIDQVLKDQDPKLWIFKIVGTRDVEAPAGFDYDEAQIDTILNQLSCFQPENITAPVNAHIEDNGTTYEVVEASAGNVLNQEAVKTAVKNAIAAGETEIDLDEAGCYETPAVTAADESLQQQVQTLNTMVTANITYDFGDNRVYTADGTTIRTWIDQTEDGNYDLNRDKVYDWVVQMARGTDTFGLEHEFTTSTGATITLEGGDYGWCINRDNTTDDLIAAIKAGQVTTLEPQYLYKGVDRGINDIGDTYAEVCIESQTMWVYKDGQLMNESAIVSGNESTGFSTPNGGVYAVDAKKADADFPTWGITVAYWLPFVDGAGIHPATWRSSFGGDIYKTNGSHGCINAPMEAAAAAFDALEIGYPVVVYYSESQVTGVQPTNEVHAG